MYDYLQKFNIVLGHFMRIFSDYGNSLIEISAILLFVLLIAIVFLRKQWRLVALLPLVAVFVYRSYLLYDPTNDAFSILDILRNCSILIVLLLWPQNLNFLTRSLIAFFLLMGLYFVVTVQNYADLTHSEYGWFSVYLLLGLSIQTVMYKGSWKRHFQNFSFILVFYVVSAEMYSSKFLDNEQEIVVYCPNNFDKIEQKLHNFENWDIIEFNRDSILGDYAILNIKAPFHCLSPFVEHALNHADTLVEWEHNNLLCQLGGNFRIASGLYPAHFKSYQLPALQKRVANIGGSKTQVMVCDIDESTPLVEHTSAIMGILENGFYSMAYSQDSQESLFDSKLEFIHSKSEFNLAKELTLLCHGNEVIAIPFGVNDYIDGDRNVIDRILNPICNNNILVCAAGNDDDNAKNVFPACLPNVIVVSSADLSVANDVSGIDLALQFPGANIEAGTWVVDGTSFACAQAAGYIALALRLHPSFSASAIFTKITGMKKNCSRYGCDVNTDILLESNY